MGGTGRDGTNGRNSEDEGGLKPPDAGGIVFLLAVESCGG